MTIICLVIIAVLQLLDIYTTYRILSAGGVEKNGVVDWCIRQFGLLPGLFAVKVAFMAILIYLASLPLPQTGMEIRDGFLVAVVGLYVWVVVHNFRQLDR